MADRRSIAAAPSSGPQLWQASRLIAHHLVRRGYGFCAAYPGSPTTLITDELDSLSRSGAVTFKYATNEKVALEMAGGVALAGGRAAAVMKHVGLNVALDAAMALAYTGHRGALLLVVGDDPPCESSSTEQDSRVLARFLGVPCFEPASIDELAEMIDLATQVSQDVGILAMLRVTTSLCYSSAALAYERATRETAAPAVEIEPPRSHRPFILLPAISREDRVAALERTRAVQRLGDAPAFWAERPGAAESPVAFLVQNALYEPFLRAAARLGIDPPVWRSRLAWPLPAGAVTAFLARHPKVVVVEELDTVLEEQAVMIAHRGGLPTRIEGSALFPRHGTLDEERIASVLAQVLGLPFEARFGERAKLALHARPPTFCPGCPHTTFFYSLKHVLDTLPERPFVASDIGCYTLGTQKGLEIGDVVLCMGAGISVATGIALAGRPSVALIGDSTFLHAGLPALNNAANLRAPLLVCILDNGHAAMTGGPAIPPATDLAATARSLGATRVEVVDPFDAIATQDAMRRLLAGEGVSVLVAKSPCALTIPALPRRPRVDLALCTGCGDCVTKIHCPAISLNADRKFQVDGSLCVGCGFCSTICPEHALTPEAIPP